MHAQTLPYHPVLLAVLVVAAGSIAACETVVDVSAPADAPQLVAQGFFSADSLWVVRLTHTVPYAGAQRPGTVDDAAVTIEEGGRLLLPLVRVDSGLYVGTGPVAEAGRAYTLRASAPRFGAVEGRDTLPAALHVQRFERHHRERGANARLVEAAVTLRDPPGDDYYALIVVQHRWHVDPQAPAASALPPTIASFRSDDAALQDDELAFLDPERQQYRTAFFADDLFDGRQHTLTFEVRYGVPVSSTDALLLRSFEAVLLSVSEDFYRYWKTAARQAAANEDPFAEPLRVHSNMTGGVGIFAGFRYERFPLGPPPDSLCRAVLQDAAVCRGLPARPVPSLPAAALLPGLLPR